MSESPAVAKTANNWVSGVVASVSGFTLAVFQLLAVFGVMIDPGQQAAVVAFESTTIGIFGPYLAGRFIHNRVTPWDPVGGAAAPVGVAPAHVDDGEGALG